MMVEEEEEREKKQEQERMEQKALLNLSKGLVIPYYLLAMSLLLSMDTVPVDIEYSGQSYCNHIEFRKINVVRLSCVTFMNLFNTKY